MNLRLATVGLALDQVLINSSDRRDAKFRDRETRDGLGWRGTQIMHQVVLRCAGQYLNSKDSIDSGASDTACWNLTRTAWVHIIGCYISIHMYIYVCVCAYDVYIPDHSLGRGTLFKEMRE